MPWDAHRVQGVWGHVFRRPARELVLQAQAREQVLGIFDHPGKVVAL